MYSEQISIHSARVGGDLVPEVIKKAFNYFNPLRPCGRRRTQPQAAFGRAYFNPLRPCGRRRGYVELSLANGTISIHSARVGGDRYFFYYII